jgi:hypothetical protein
MLAPGPTGMSRTLSGEVVVGDGVLPSLVMVVMVTAPACDGGLAMDYDGPRKIFARVPPSRSGG